MNMKEKLILLVIGVLVLGVSHPGAVSALSCLTPAEHIPQLVAAGESTIFTGEIIAARETSGNVTELDIAVSEVFQGEADETITVEYEYDDTWGYLCAGTPGTPGTVEAFIVREGEGLPLVTYSLATDSDLYTILTDSLEGTTTSATTTPAVPVEEEPARDLMLEVIELLQQLLGLLQLR
jgi:hypothetical protein